MNAFMCIHVHMCVYMLQCIRTNVFIYAHTCLYISVCICASLYVSTVYLCVVYVYFCGHLTKGQQSMSCAINLHLTWSFIAGDQIPVIFLWCYKCDGQT